jgi:RHS repeat-associated protein
MKSSFSADAFGSPMSNRSFNASSSRYGFNSQEKDDEIASSGSINTAMFWEYDTRLGRRWNIDPKPTIGYSDYSAFLNNPIVYTDPMGDKVKNGYEKSKANAEKNLETKKNILSLASGGLSKTFAQFKVNKAERQLNRIKDLYNQTDALIKDFEKNNNKDFTELDNLKDGGGTTVDAYIRVEDGLYSNRFDNTVGGVEQKKDLDGLTQVQPQAYKTVKTTDGTGAYLPVKSSLYGNNTVVIIVDSDVKNKLRVVSHESGHAIYSVTKMLEYVMWLQLNPNTAPGGHGPGNPSGKEADLREAPFIKK